MPPHRQIFKTHGSQDASDVQLKGNEFGRSIRLITNRCAFGFGIFFAIVAGAYPVLINITMGNMLTTMTTQLDFLGAMKTLALRLFFINLGMIAAMTLCMSIRMYANACYLVDLRRSVYTSLMNQDVPFFDATPTGVLISRLSEDVTLIRETYIDKLMMIVQNLAQAVGGVILAFITAWIVTLAVFIALPISAIIYWVGDRCIDKLWVQYNDSSSAAASKAEEIISSFRTVKSFDNELYEADLYCSQLDGVNDVFKKTSVAHGIKDGLIQFFVWLMIAGLIFFTCWCIIERPEFNVETGDMMVLMMSLMFASIGISQVLSLSDDFMKAKISAAKLLDIVERVPKVDRMVGDKLDHVRGKVEFRDVSFKYESRDQYAVRHLSFIINPGETVALVGESGCGKSTTLQLLQRFYEIDEGQILVDDVDITTLSPHYLRSQISVVPQGPVLFSMSVKENIMYAVQDATDDEIYQAANVGNAHNFIMELPENYETKVQQMSLSGGQKQRICISRAILANSPILLLDEATAALDTESEQLVQQSLEQFRHGKTAILVAHRLATVVHADKILVIQDGHVVEEGTHKDLLQTGGIYSDLVKYQLQ